MTGNVRGMNRVAHFAQADGLAMLQDTIAQQVTLATPARATTWRDTAGVVHGRGEMPVVPDRFAHTLGGTAAPHRAHQEWHNEQQGESPTILLLDIAVEALADGTRVIGSLGTYRMDVLRAIHVDLPLLSFAAGYLREIPLAKRLDDGKVVRLLALA